MNTATEKDPTETLEQDYPARRTPRSFLVPAGVLAAGVIAAILLFGGGEPEAQVLAFDGPHYESVEELTAASELTIAATIGDVVHRFADPLPAEDAAPREMVVLALESSDLSEPSFLVRSRYDESVIVEGKTTLNSGDEVVLFLSELDRSEERGSEAFQAGVADIEGKIYTLVGEGQGVFDIVRGQATPRDEHLLEEIGVLSLDELTIAGR